MRLHISLNGNDIDMYHLTALEGILDALMKPAGYKKAVVNENAAQHGTRVLSAPSVRKKASRSITLPFLLRSVSLIDLNNEVTNLEHVLEQGKDGTGINHLYIAELDTTYKLYYDSMHTYANFGLDGYARIAIKFTEYNPNDRIGYGYN